MASTPTCPQCGRPTLRIANSTKHYCHACDKEIGADALSSPSVAPQKSKAIKPPCERESGLVEAIVQVLELYKYKVLKVGQWRADKSGSDAGVPDLLVYGDNTPRPLALEVKTKVGRLSDAQKELYDAGRIVIVRSPQEALDAARKEFK